MDPVLYWLGVACDVLIGVLVGGGLMIAWNNKETTALERIARRVWGAEASELLGAKGGHEALAAEIDQRVPEAIGDAAAAGWMVASCLSSGRTHRFRALGDRVELGVSIEGRFLTITHLGAKGLPSLVTQADWFGRAASAVVREASKARAVEVRETRIDDYGRLSEWVRFGP